MAPKGVSNWRRPYTSIYNDNYKYGTGLYSDTLSDIEKRYTDSMGRTQMRADRPDLTCASFLGSAFASSPTPGGAVDNSAATTRPTSLSPVAEVLRGSNFESRLSSALHSAYADDDPPPERLARQTSRGGDATPRPKSLYDDAVFWSLPKVDHSPAVDFDLSKGRKAARETSNGPSSTAWREKSRDLQNQVDQLEKSMSDSSSRLRSELSSLKSKCHGELSEMSGSVEHSSQQANDLQKTVKRQAQQLTELQSAYSDAERSIQNSLDEMDTWHNRCKSLKKEMDRLRDEVEQATLKSNSVSRG